MYRTRLRTRVEAQSKARSPAESSKKHWSSAPDQAIPKWAALLAAARTGAETFHASTTRSGLGTHSTRRIYRRRHHHHVRLDSGNSAPPSYRPCRGISMNDALVACSLLMRSHGAEVLRSAMAWNSIYTRTTSRILPQAPYGKAQHCPSAMIHSASVSSRHGFQSILCPDTLALGLSPWLTILRALAGYNNGRL